ncbi:type I polyketide synthase [Streptomyces profundus]|uniref:type I polyketide synthase n=1 Tax=Streptomyces profundus TaxID=2867410 RepID=UPI001D1684E6|nr:type I polyketide synthase [Streptomyces sp. MA3_2.13]UED87413.1 SDR family NAD(P)-dependent oxidoreductase [Streptomyces sp. MA3_2.13]
MTTSSDEIIEALRASLTENEQLRQQNEELIATAQEPIAIVSMSCRFPGGADSPEELWRFLLDEGDAVSGFPDDRGWPRSEGEGAFVRGVDRFDAGFFGVSPREALTMDPQQRLLLATSWEAMERGGLVPTELVNSLTGVYLGATATTYGQGAEEEIKGSEGHLVTGVGMYSIAGRLSYTYGFQGPAVTVDTACSSSMVAIHQAVQALRAGECALALAGGATVLATPDMFTSMSTLDVLTFSGRCRSFAAAADGTAFSEGVGVLVLERLSEARRNGHPVLAVIRGSAINHDGPSNGMTAPNGRSQRKVIRQALANARLAPEDVDVVEAHGTGTTLGDPIEAQALLATYGQRPAGADPLWLGSIKSNIGHSLAAAGVAGVIKMVLALRNEVLPRTLHVDEPSPHIDWSAGEVRLLEEARPWPRGDQPRRVAVSSFGISGTNGHLIIEEAPSAPARPADAGGEAADATRWRTPVQPWLVSAKSAESLAAQAERLAGFAEPRTDLEPAAVANALARHRVAFDRRAVVVGSTTEEFVAGLRALAAGEPAPHVTAGTVGKPGRVAFVFPGQGAQWAGMAHELLDASPVFAAEIARCEEAFAAEVPWSLTEVLARAPGAPGLDRVDVVQPVSFAVMVALAALWRAHGVEPAAVVGHSQGEIAAAHVAGALSLRDAARVVVRRSAAITKLAGRGAMASIGVSRDAVAQRIAAWEGRLSLAAVNGPNSTVVAGDPEALEALVAACEADGVRARRIAVDYASHSPQIEEIEDDLRRQLADVEPTESPVLFCSTVTGEPLDTAGLDADYWYRNLRRPVEFQAAVDHLLAAGYGSFVEVSSHPVLSLGLTETVERAEASAVVLPTLKRDNGGPTQFFLALAQAHAHGLPVDWTPALPVAPAALEVPTYAFARDRYWLSPSGRVGDLGAAGIAEAGHPLLSALLALADGDTVVLTGCLSLTAQPWLAGHAVEGSVLLPGAAFAELAVRAGDEVGLPHVHELTLEAPLILDQGAERQLQVRVGPLDPAGSRQVSVHSRPRGEDDAPWTRHASGLLADDGQPVPAPESTVWPPAGAEAADTEDFYDRLTGTGYQYTSAFRGLRAAWRRGDEVFAEVELPDEHRESASSFGIHPALLDAVLHTGLLRAGDQVDGIEVHLPWVWRGFTLAATGATALRVRSALTEDGKLTVSATDPDGSPVLAVESIVNRPVASLGGAGDSGGPDLSDALFRLAWEPLGQPATAVASGDVAVLAPHGTGDQGLGLEGLPAYRSLPELAEAVDAGRPLPGTVLLPCPPAIRADNVPTVDPDAARGTVLDTLELLKDWIDDARWTSARLVLVTSGAVATAVGQEVGDLTAAAVRGLVRSASAEHPGRFGLLDTGAGGVDLTGLRAALDCGESEVVATRDGEPLVPRLRRIDSGAGLVLPADEGWRLAWTGSGSLDDMALDPAPDVWEPLGERQVRVRVRAAGLNFRDVVTALGMLQVDDAAGAEAAGVVVATGAGVTGVAVGDHVMGVTAGAFASVNVVDERLLVPVPRNWAWETAASLPVAFATAWYGLGDLAGLSAGEKVLVHAGAGGVGMAAIQLARHWGAEVFATAHPDKWHVLRGFGLDDDHIASSRDLVFEKQFGEVTDGRGIDVVLNSLAGEFVDASMRLLGTGGRFLEMGKTDIRTAEQASAVRDDVSYAAFDLSEAGPERLNAILRLVVSALEEGRIAPLPIRTRDMRRAPEVFRWMAQGRHIGKNVLRVPGTPATGTVLITGGTGTLGRLIARRLVERHGVRHLLLVSRRGERAPGADEARQELAELGAHVTVAACDTGDRAQLAALLASLPEDAPLSGVVHAAGVLDDGMIHSLEPGQVDRVLRPKLDAAVHLHELTAGLDLEWFVMFSSAAGLFGASGQGNYAAANTFLDTLAYHRQSLGLPGVSLAWGHWQQASEMTGHLSDSDHQRMARGGMAPMSSERGLELFDAALRTDEPLLLTAPLDVRALQGAAPEQIPPLMRALVRPARRQAAGRQVSSLTDRLAALPAAEREREVTDLVRGQAATILGHGSRKAIDPERGFQDMGFDSLTAVELRNRLSADTGLRLPATLIFDYPTPAALAALLLSELAPDTEPETPGDAREAEVRRALATLPMERFEEAGIADVLLRLARGDDPSAGGSAADPTADRTIGEMSADDLISLVLGDNES